MDDSTTERHTGTVKMNPAGPHFYIDPDDQYQSPPEDADVATNWMNERLTEMNERHGWPITHAHIEAHTAITSVEWSGEGYDREFEFQDFDVSLDWYSQERLWEWDFE